MCSGERTLQKGRLHFLYMHVFIHDASHVSHERVLDHNLVAAIAIRGLFVALGVFCSLIGHFRVQFQGIAAYT